MLVGMTGRNIFDSAFYKMFIPANSKLYFKETAESTFFPADNLILYLTNKQVTGQYIDERR